MNRRQLLSAITAVGASALLPTQGFAAGSASRVVVNGLDTSVLNEEFVGLLKKGGVDSLHLTYEELELYGDLYRVLDRLADDITLVTSVADIHATKAAGKIAATLGAQHANELEKMLVKTAFGTYASLASMLRVFYELGLRTQGLCYNVTNVFGGGCLDHAVPLTEAGRRLVEEIHKLNIILDVGGHTGEQTSLDAIAMSDGVPIICTHTNVAALNPNRRAISDRLAVAIAKSGGVIGVTAISDYHVRNPKNYQAQGPRSPQASLDQHLDQYDYLKRLVGAEHIGLGPDFVWGWGETFELNTEQSLTFPPDTLSNGAPINVVKDYENISKLSNVEEGLRHRGWNQAELDALMGGNWLRVYRQVWGG